MSVTTKIDTLEDDGELIESVSIHAPEYGMDRRSIAMRDRQSMQCEPEERKKPLALQEEKRIVTFTEPIAQCVYPPRFNVGRLGNRVIIRVNSSELTIEDAKEGAKKYESILKQSDDQSLFVFYNLEKLSMLNITPLLLQLEQVFKPLYELLEQKLACWSAWIPTNPLITTTLSKMLLLYPSRVPSVIFSTKLECENYLRTQQTKLEKKNN